jgi:response regulator RpfG family c-di-GMP phosphodiesterase
MNTKIAVIDDDWRVRKVLRIHLQKAGYEVVEGEDAESGLTLLSVHPEKIDVVICDLKMPKISGLELLDEIKRRFPALPVIVLTGLIELKTAADVIKRGAFEYLIKPVKREELLATIEGALAERRVDEQEFGPLLEKQLKFQVGVVNAVEMKNPFRKSHSRRVSQYAISIARSLSLSEGMVKMVEYGALLHDIGLIGISDSLLQQKGALSREEQKQIQAHPEIGAHLIRDLYCTPIINVILSHHERFDGTGYPGRLKGEAIPLPARIVAIADVFDAITNERPFRKAMPKETALSTLMADSGKAFCPSVLHVFLSILNHS